MVMFAVVSSSRWDMRKVPDTIFDYKTLLLFNILEQQCIIGGVRTMNNLRRYCKLFLKMEINVTDSLT